MQLRPATLFSLIGRNRLRPAMPVVLMVCAIVVTACSRQADGPFEPINDSTPTLGMTAVSQSLNSTEDGGSAVAGDTTATFAPLPTEDLNLADDIPAVTRDPDAPPIFTLAASPTLAQAPDDNGIIDPLGTDELTPTLSGDFITPGAPSGPIDLSDEATTASGGTLGTGDTDLSDLLPTPTDLLNFSGTDAAEIDAACLYIVQRGDSLFGIALELEVSLDDLRAVNPEVQDTDVIQIDQELIIPDCDDEAADGTLLGNTTELPTPGIRGTATPQAAATEAATGRTHEVAAGETLYIIAQEYNVTINAIVQANSLANPNRLSVGQLLIIPDEE